MINFVRKCSHIQVINVKKIRRRLKMRWSDEAKRDMVLLDLSMNMALDRTNW